MRNDKQIAVLTHIYYGYPDDDLKEFLLNLGRYNTIYFFNISNATSEKELVIYRIKNDFPNAIIIQTPNIGKDIGGKLALIDLYLKLNLRSDYFIFLHDKKSPHTSLGETWRKKLFRIIEPQNIAGILELFETDKKIGIISAKEFITNEFDKKNDAFNCSSNNILKSLINKYKLNLNTYDFVGGTMFYVRGEIIKTFFNKNSPLDIRATFENGNVLDHNEGTNTHAWERMLSWTAIDQGYYLKGI